MEPQDQATMRKETIRKEDGRYLIYYRFEESDAERVSDQASEAE